EPANRPFPSRSIRSACAAASAGARSATHHHGGFALPVSCPARAPAAPPVHYHPDRRPVPPRTPGLIPAPRSRLAHTASRAATILTAGRRARRLTSGPLLVSIRR